MARFEEVAGKVFWAVGTLFVAVLVLGIGGVDSEQPIPGIVKPCSRTPSPNQTDSVYASPQEHQACTRSR